VPRPRLSRDSLVARDSHADRSQAFLNRSAIDLLSEPAAAQAETAGAPLLAEPLAALRGTHLPVSARVPLSHTRAPVALLSRDAACNVIHRPARHALCGSPVR
jgi:hypothetical protein